MRSKFIVLCLLLLSATAAHAQVSINLRLPSASIGINIPLYPELVPVPGYPVYYAPNMNSNYFFYDGLYWVYQNDNWYASSWYNGPWGLVAPETVPVFLLRVPVGYYRNPPRYFYGWRRDAPPQWGVRWGYRWEQYRRGWDHWDRRAYVAPAPLPLYQRQYSGERYPHGERQRRLYDKDYRYQSRERIGARQYPEHDERRAPAPSQERYAPQRGQDRHDQGQQNHRDRNESRGHDRDR